MPALPLLCAVAAALCFGTASVLQCVGARRLDRGHGIDLTFLRALLGQRLFIAGTALDVAGFAASVAALGSLPLFLVQSLSSASAAVTAVLAWVVLGERLAPKAAMGVGSMVVGLSLLTPAAVPSDAGTFPLVQQLLFVLAVPVLAGLSCRLTRAGGGAPVVLGTVAGVALAAASIGARGLPLEQGPWWLLGQPLSWAVAALAAVGMVAFSAGLQRGATVRVSAACLAAEVLVAAAFGVLVCGDRARPGLAVVAGVGFVATLAGAMLVATDRRTGAAAVPAVAAGGPLAAGDLRCPAPTTRTGAARDDASPPLSQPGTTIAGDGSRTCPPVAVVSVDLRTVPTSVEAEVRRPFARPLRAGGARRGVRPPGARAAVRAATAPADA